MGGMCAAISARRLPGKMAMWNLVMGAAGLWLGSGVGVGSDRPGRGGSRSAGSVSGELAGRSNMGCPT